MPDQVLLNELCEVVAEKLGVAPQNVTAESAFVRDLGADSLDMVGLMLELEDRYNITITEQEVGEFITLGDAARFVQSRLQAVPA